MNVRDDLLTALVCEVLGPRKGAREILPDGQDPRQEYITGVLEPRNARSQDERIEDMVDVVIEETSSDEDQDTQGYVAATGIFSPALDPRALPRSIGLSLTVAANDENPQIEICFTWARYRKNERGCFERVPQAFLTGKISVIHDELTFRSESDVDVRFLIRSKQVEQGYRVSIFLINERTVQDEQRPKSEDYIFQPQIRVHLLEGTHLLPIHVVRSTSPLLEDENLEEDSLALQYQHRTALARGHMCGAIWKDIDPEQPYSCSERPDLAPFIWTDMEAVESAERSKFSLADARTEFIPIYLIQSPDITWSDKHGPSPQLEAEKLAEAWKPDVLHEFLSPLVTGYQNWIEEQSTRLSQLPSHLPAAARRNLEECRRVAERMQEGIDTLCQDEDARLAFCFANKAIAVQAAWKNQSSLHQKFSWRPFQMAFLLLNIPPLAIPSHPDRSTCDLLWFPTGGGKTEAYLGLTAFLLGLRRLRARHNTEGDITGAGVAVLSRYTLRLLTIQQFRRALGVIVACELLRVWELENDSAKVGWRPKECARTETFLWGGIRFSAGLWVGGGVTPNQLRGFGPLPQNRNLYFPGALDILKGLRKNYNGPDEVLKKKAAYLFELNGEPAQITQCPVCNALLAVPEEGLGEGEHHLHLIGKNLRRVPDSIIPIPKSEVRLQIAGLKCHDNGYHTLSLKITIKPQGQWKADEVDTYVWQQLLPLISDKSKVSLAAARPSRPGYFILHFKNRSNNLEEADFELFCPDPSCELNQHAWAERVPLSRSKTGGKTTAENQLTLFSQENRPDLPNLSDRLNWQTVPEPFQKDGSGECSRAIPISAFTVDDQVYSRCPSLVISTVDKFARLAYEGEAAALFGNIDHYHARYGYYRKGHPPVTGSNKKRYQPHPPMDALHCPVSSFPPPDLILQDELHLIEGPLGSMVGIYETAVDLLCHKHVEEKEIPPKYIASTATVRRAGPQVKALFNRSLVQFPPPALSADDRFFAVSKEAHPLDNTRSGRLYVGICAPGRGAQTPIVRLWSALLQRARELKDSGISEKELDPFWTLVGYFNALRELAGALSLYRQDIPEWLKHRGLSTSERRSLDEYHRLELSSRSKSTELPNLLRRLEVALPAPQRQMLYWRRPCLAQEWM